MSGILYIVGTPIGNLEDMSVRGVRILSEVDFIAAEDTRVSLKLLNHFNIKKPMISYHDHNQKEKGNEIIQKLLHGDSCAIITDAGMPCISDPGEDLVRLCAQNQIETKIIPGPSASLSALALSGLDTSRFVFEGFLTTQKSEKRDSIEDLQREKRTLIFYEAPHKLLQTLESLLQILGNRPISIARELTKIYEEVIRTTLEEAVLYYQQNKPRGEFVLVVAGADDEEPVSMVQAIEMVQKLVQKGIPLSQAAKDVAHQTGYKKGDLYKASI